MDGARFDRFSQDTSRRGVLRGVAALLAVTGGLRAAPSAALDRDCSRFILAGGPDKDDKFKHVDDDLKVELQRKGSRRWKTVFEDDDGTVNDGGRNIKPIRFRAEYGDKIRIVATNKVAGGCELDEIYLFCDRGQGRKRLLERFRCSDAEKDRINFAFVDETFRLKP